MQAAFERAMKRLVLGPAIDPADSEAVRSCLIEHGLASEDIEAILEAGAERLLLYRSLVRTGLRRAIERGLSRTTAVLGPIFEESFARFLHDRGPATHYLRDTPGELVAFCEPSWCADPRVPAWLPDLARLEVARHEVSAAPPHEGEGETRALELDAPVRFIAAMRLLHQDWAVHALDESEVVPPQPSEESSALLVYRDAEHRVSALQITPLAAGIVGGLVAGRTLRDAIARACAQHGTEVADAVASTSAFLAELAERGILLGAG